MTDLFGGWFWLGGAAAFTVVATCFGHIKSAYSQVIGRVVITITVSGYQADAVLLYFRNHLVASRFGPRTYIGWKLYFQPARRLQLMPMEVASSSGRLYWQGWCPVWVAKSKENVDELESGLTAEHFSYQTLAVTFARGTLDPDELIQVSTRYYNEQTRVYDATEGRRHLIRYIHGSAGMSMPELAMSRSKEPACPTSGSDIRGCLGNRPLGFSFTELGTDQSAQKNATARLALRVYPVIGIDVNARFLGEFRWFSPILSQRSARCQIQPNLDVILRMLLMKNG